MGSDYLLGMVFPPRMIKMFWNQIAVIVAQHCKYAKCIELYFSMVKVTNSMLSVFYHMCKRGLSIDLTHTQLCFFPVVDLSFLSSGNSLWGPEAFAVWGMYKKNNSELQIKNTCGFSGVGLHTYGALNSHPLWPTLLCSFNDVCERESHVFWPDFHQFPFQPILANIPGSI